MIVRCDRWQGWGDGRVRVRDALKAAASLRSRGVLGIDRFVRSCESTGAYEYALVPPSAIDRLVLDNVDVLVLDTKTRAVFRWAGFNLMSDYGDDAIRSKFLKDICVAYRRRLSRWDKYAPVTPVVRAALTGILRAGYDTLTPETAAASVADELGCSIYGAMMSGRIRWAFRFLTIALLIAAVARTILVGLALAFSIYYMIATTAIRMLLGVDVASLPARFAGMCVAAFAAMVAHAYLRGKKFVKVAKVFDHTLPMYILYRMLA
jgi:hypothetical protein